MGLRRLPHSKGNFYESSLCSELITVGSTAQDFETLSPSRRRIGTDFKVSVFSFKECPYFHKLWLHHWIRCCIFISKLQIDGPRLSALFQTFLRVHFRGAFIRIQRRKGARDVFSITCLRNLRCSLFNVTELEVTSQDRRPVVSVPTDTVLVGEVVCGRDKRIFGVEASSQKAQPEVQHLLVLLLGLCRRLTWPVLSFSIGEPCPALVFSLPVSQVVHTLSPQPGVHCNSQEGTGSGWAQGREGLTPSWFCLTPLRTPDFSLLLLLGCHFVFHLQPAAGPKGAHLLPVPVTHCLCNLLPSPEGRLS